MSFAALSSRLFPTARSQAMRVATIARPTSAFARFYTTKFSSDHEWIKIENGVGTVGITAHAQGQLGDIVFVELPVLEKILSRGESCGIVESVKAASEIYTPVSGQVTEVNQSLGDEPELLSEHPEGEGWIYKIKLSDEDELKELMDKATYDEFCGTQ